MINAELDEGSFGDMVPQGCWESTVLSIRKISNLGEEGLILIALSIYSLKTVHTKKKNRLCR